MASDITLLAENCVFVDSILEVPPATRIVLRKATGAPVMFLDTVVGQEEIRTGDGPIEFDTLLVQGDSANLVVVGVPDATMHIDSLAPAIRFGGDLHVQGDLFVAGELVNETVDAFQIQDPLCKLSAGQTATDLYTQGIYSTYFDGLAVAYRGVAWDITRSAFVAFGGSPDLPTDNGALTPNVDCSVYSFATSNDVQFGLGNNNVQLAADATAGLIYTVPLSGTDQTFALANLPQTYTGTKTFSALSLTEPVGGTAFDMQVFGFLAFLNPTNSNQAIGPQTMVTNVATRQEGNLVALLPMIQFGNGTAGVIEFGNIQVRLRAGTYFVGFQYSLANNRSICELYCTALGVSIVFDGYVATTSTVAGAQQVQFNVAQAGLYTFGFRQNGKNASSSSYVMTMSPTLVFTQNA